MASAAARQSDRDVTFEAHVQEDGRWLIIDLLDDRKTALRFGRELATLDQHDAVRIVRDEFDHRTGRSFEMVLFDSEFKQQPITDPPPRAKVDYAATRLEADSRALKWPVLASAVIGLSLGGLTFLALYALY